jgi:ornithine carbamoyltransferase
MDSTVVDMKGRSFLTLLDLSEEEILYLIDLAIDLKEKKKDGVPHRCLEGQNIALLFEKPSMIARSAYTAACVDAGAHPAYFGKEDLDFGTIKSLPDTAKVLGRMYDGIIFYGNKQTTVEDLAVHSGIPVWNGMTDTFYPSQLIADFLTIQENLGHLKGIRLVYAGNGRSNVATSLLIGGAKVGMDVRICSPEEFFPDKKIIQYAEEISKSTRAKIMVTSHIQEAVDGADAVYTDAWVAVEDEEHAGEKIHLLQPYQVNERMLELTGNKNVLFLHCLPSFHDLSTEMGREVYEKYGIKEMEVTDEVFQSRNSIVFDQAENRLHTMKAIMVAANGLEYKREDGFPCKQK